MSLFLFKTILSIVLLLLTGAAAFTMFEILGRTEKRYSAERMKSVHRVTGYLYLALFLFITYLCLSFITDSRTDLTPRSNFHGIFAMAVISLLALKIVFVRTYRQYYTMVPVIGITITLATIGMFWTSGGYYLLVTEEVRTETTSDGTKGNKTPSAGARQGEKMGPVRTDPESIGRGKNLFDSKCAFCHDPYSEKTIVGPGLRGILKNPALPVSKRPATPENIRRQLREPFSAMPPFDHLTEEEIMNIIAFLNTL